MERTAKLPNDLLDQKGPPQRSLLTKPVLLTISIYAAHAFLEICDSTLVSLVYTTPIRFGGLGLDPATMGTCLAIFGTMTGILPFFFFHRIVKFLGPRRALLTLMSSLIFAYLLFPINGTRAHHTGVDIVVWIFLLLHLLLMVCINMTYGTPRPFTPLHCSSLNAHNTVSERFRLYLHIHVIGSSSRKARRNKWPRTDCRVRAAGCRPRDRRVPILVLIRE